MKKLIASLAGFIIFFSIWELCSLYFKDLLFVLPSPLNVFSTLIECRKRLLFHSLVTLKEMLGGFALALSISFPLAWAMVRFKTSRAVLQPFFIVIQCLPMFTLAPIMVIWFGWSYTAIVVPTALMIFFPLTLNIYQGLRSTPPDFLEFFKSNQATPFQTFFKLRLPWAVPHIFAGFRISSAIAGIGAIAGEWAGAQNGLGMLMLESRRNTDLEMTFSALFSLTLMSAVLYLCVITCEKIALPPRPTFFSSFTKSRKKTLAYLSFFFLLSIPFLMLSCEKSPQKTRLILDWLPNPNHVPLYAGIEKGFFEEEGIHLTVQKMHESGGGISYLTSGQADLLINHLPGTLRAVSRGAQIKIVGVLIKEPLSSLIYLKDPRIQQCSDLTDHTLGYCLGGPDTAFLDYLLEQGNIKPKEKRNVSVDLISAIGTRSVDFIYGGFWNIEPSQLRSFGIETDYFKMKEFNVPDYYEMIILGNTNTLETSPDFVARFRKALQNSLNFCKEYPEEAFSLYLQHHPDKREKTIAWEREAWKITSSLLVETQEIDTVCIQNFYNWLMERKILKNHFDYQQLIDFQA